MLYSFFTLLFYIIDLQYGYTKDSDENKENKILY